MHPVIGQCPVCRHSLHVTRLQCRQCDSRIDGQFSLGRLYALPAEQLQFIETFVRCEGKLNRVGSELDLSYPSVRSRLDEVIQALGYPVGNAEPDPVTPEERRAILADLSAGKIDAHEAAKRLRS
ncbi:MAG TPA: DUF2089 domain-containing protein [Anaerolineae bacterium]|nr:DUF2089 domain-containing protein [Anaerolineae bacterium]